MDMDNRGGTSDMALVDLFCGAGGLGCGFAQAGFTVAAGVDLAEACRHAVEANHGAAFVRRNAAELTPADAAALFGEAPVRVLAGCPPCQPFSTLANTGRRPARPRDRAVNPWALLSAFGRLAVEVRPDAVVLENVPRLRTHRGGRPFRDLVARLEEGGYFVTWSVLNAADFDTPQLRLRLILIASRLGPPALPAPTGERRRTVDGAIAHLPPLAAGETDPRDPLHRASALSQLNLQRIRATPPGGSWRNWDPELWVDCHRRYATDDSLRRAGGFARNYTRMRGDEPAPTLTTRFHTLGCGPFGHPVQDRALSLREGALLQGFPENYAFVPDGAPVFMRSAAGLIGNAVPVPLARAVAASLRWHLAA